MKTTSRNTLIVLLLLAVILTALISLTSGPHIIINDQEITGLSGFGLSLMGISIAIIVCIFAALCAGFLIAGVSALMILIAAAMICSFAFAILPLALPFLILAGIVYLLQRHKPVRTPGA